jgi:hypothetical protein
VELDDICPADQPETKAAQGDAACNSYIPSGFGLTRIHLLVEMPSLDRQYVLRPDLLDVNQGELTLAKHDVL